MKAEIRGEYIYIRLKMLSKPHLTSSGKNLLIATTRGPRPAQFKIRKRVPRVIANVFIPPDPEK
jgi:hypothetical protein